jgi:hypothetical protein
MVVVTFTEVFYSNFQTNREFLKAVGIVHMFVDEVKAREQLLAWDYVEDEKEKHFTKSKPNHWVVAKIAGVKDYREKMVAMLDDCLHEGESK